MLRINENTRLHFVYNETDVNFHSRGEEVVETKPTIECVVTDNDDNVIASSMVTRHHSDIDDKIKGRTYAVKKTLSMLPNRAVKKQAWEALRNNNIKLKF